MSSLIQNVLNSHENKNLREFGNGVDRLNCYLSSKLFGENCDNWQEALFSFLHLHEYNSQQLLINERIKNESQLSEKVKRVLNLLEHYPSHTSYENFRFELRSFGFEAGWGNTAFRVRETLSLLEQLMNSGERQLLEKFISRIPMVFKVLLTSPQRCFGQEADLERSDTEAQVKELEKQIQENLKLAGIDVLGVIKPKIIVLTGLIPNSQSTNSNQRLEKISDTKNCWILRVPFHEFQPEITQDSNSRFEIYPYLETFAIDSERELFAEFQGKPDLIISNSTDDNLVTFLLSQQMNVTQCVIARTLEKSKYIFSDVDREGIQQQYDFSL
ncbi:MAG: hypothetical protein ACFB2X_21515 [Rivularia sp. (in: cyanobacteria)]